MPAAKIISGSVVPATSRARRTDNESLSTRLPGIRRGGRQVTGRIGEAPEVRQGELWPGESSLEAGPRGGTSFPSEIAVGDGGEDHGAQFGAHRRGTRRRQLGHEDGDQFLSGVDPERGGRRAAPGVFAGAAGN